MVDTSAALASLYQGPLAEFITRRRAVVSQLKASGHKDVAARLATAAKPSRAAHLVNQVFWRARPAYDALLDAGMAARAAQQARLLGDGDADLSLTLRLRDQAVQAAVDEALSMASSEAMGIGESLAGPVRASFEALAAHGRDGRLAHGQLVEEVPLPGLQALAGLVLPAGAPPPARRFEIVARQATPEPAVPRAPDPQRLAAEARLSDAQEREALARERRVELERALEAASGELNDAEREFEAARARLASATQAVEAGRTALDAAAREAERRQEALAAAAAAVAAFDTPSNP
ncbi:hypothetical protein TBR22_A20870 [Luteitalea sp. TBR-22]|nr:hypothetical protein TBR22_A20870 [Luteitalea sp. TBR-22]